METRERVQLNLFAHFNANCSTFFQQYFLRHNFNNKVYAIRRRKEQLKQSLQEKLHMLNDIQAEIPKSAHKKPPAMPEEHADEYVEKNLEIIMTMPKEPPNPAVMSEHVIHYVMVV